MAWCRQATSHYLSQCWPSFLSPYGVDPVFCRHTASLGPNKQRVLMHGHQGWNVRHGLCHIYMIYVYIWVVYSFCLFCCLFIIVTTQFVALYKPCKPKPKPSTYDPLDNHPLAEIQIPILRLEPKQQICHQHANTDHFGKKVNRWYYNETQSSTLATKIPPKIWVEVNCNYYVNPNLTDI